VATTDVRSDTVPAPSLTRLDPDAPPRGVVLMLHGGREASTEPVDGRSASWLRCAAMQRTLHRELRDAGHATWLLRYRERGWNGGSRPVADARWALEEVRRAFGEVPVVLLGHSMGARTAVHVADDPAVLGVVALAPWFPPQEPVAALAGRQLAAAHGRADRITSYRATAAYVARARAVASGAELTDMGPVGHYMFRRVGSWNGFAAASALEMLPGPDGRK
jgi:alpha-beta hydrolase superfamily lysophospholipase